MVYIKTLELSNFRSYTSKKVEFKKGINAIIGPNGVGKTNLLEAIYFLCMGESFKTSSNKSLIHCPQNSDEITPKTPTDFEIELILLNNRSKTQQKRTLSTKDFTNSAIQVIVFSPESTNIINLTPAVRRDFIDSIIKQYDVKYAKVLLNYTHIVKQRSNLLKNAVLSNKNISDDELNVQLEFWNEKFATHSQYISDSRRRLLEKINGRISPIYSDIVKHLEKTTTKQSVQIMLETTPSDISKERIIADLQVNIAKERILGWTNVGAKSDDIAIKLNGNAIKGNSSFGEQWSIMIAFVLSIWQIMKEAEASFSNVEPILLLDDIFTGLDELRRNELIRLVKPVTQSIITCADETDIPQNISKNLIHKLYLNY